jgi:hypothetical protein
VSLGAALALAQAASAQPAPPPPPPPGLHVSAVTPAEGSTAGGSEVVIEGSGFPSCSIFAIEGEAMGGLGAQACADVIVRFGNEPGLVVASSEDAIEVLSPAHAPGPVPVSVSTPAGQGAGGPGASFTYTGTAPVPQAGKLPVVSAIEPAHGPASGFNAVKIRGAHLLAPGEEACLECLGETAYFRGQSVPVLAGTQNELYVVAPPNGPGPALVVVKTPVGESASGPLVPPPGSSAADIYTYEPPLAPIGPPGPPSPPGPPGPPAP